MPQTSFHSNMRSIDNFAIVVYTNESYIPILRVFLDELFEWNPELELPVYVISNKLPSDVPHKERVTYLESNTAWNPQGNHFSEVVKNTLPLVKEEYIFWFCEDYVINDVIDMHALKNLLEFIKNNRLDMFSFAAVSQAHTYQPIEADYDKYGFSGEMFYYTDNEYMHKFSVQPCIWKKKSLLSVVETNNISLHDMDCTRVQNKDAYTTACTKYRIFDVCPTCPEKFIISYVEIIRHGVMQFKKNGLHVDDVYDDYLKKIVIKYNIHNKAEYNKFIMFDKSYFS